MLKIIIISSLIIVYLFLLISQPALDYEFKNLEEDLSKLKQGNQILESRLAKLRSTEHLLVLAENQGMVRNNDRQWLEINQGLAIR